MKALRLWWRRRQLYRAQDVIERAGLSVVKLSVVAGTSYLIDMNGSYHCLKKVKPPKGDAYGLQEQGQTSAQKVV